MRLETQDIVDEAMSEFERDVMRALTVNAYREYTVGDGEAMAAMGVAEDWMVIDKAAMAYIASYRQLLVAEGATIINGQQIPWMRNFTTEARTKVAMIIEEGIADGLYPGKRETGVGTYPKKSVASRLQEVFNERKSHAAMVARTETAHIRGVAKAARWKEREYSIVLIFDGRGSNPCAICQQIDGQYWTVDYYNNHILEHPNCTRNASPVRPESVPPGTHVHGLGNLPAVVEVGALG